MNDQLIERIKTRIVVVGECWVWTGKLDDGYGRIRIKTKTHKAHRLSFEVHFGQIPEGKFVCHKCDNRACVNPEHLFLGTPLDNMLDMVNKGRSMTGRRHWNAKLTQAHVDAIRSDTRPHEELAQVFGVTRSTISRIQLGIRWKPINEVRPCAGEGN